VANVRESSFPRHFVEGARPPSAMSHLIRVLDGRTPVGYVVVFHLSGEAVTCNLDEVAVAQAQRRNGIGSHLVSMAAKLMLSHGFEEMEAVALIGEDRALREQWLARLGFTPYEGFGGHFLHANLEWLASGIRR
jgi:ribosomal protein S18 acetylase RimI-like enzyme